MATSEKVLDVLNKCLEIFKEDSSWFDDADTGYCPDSMLESENVGDVYLCKGWRIKELDGEDAPRGIKNESYYLDFCWADRRFFEITREGELIGEVR